MTDKNLIWKVQCDTYKREIERYGSNTIEIVESIFYVDSECAIDLIEMLNSQASPKNMRWLIALKSIDQYLRLFFKNIEIRSQVIAYFSDNFKKEFGFYGKSQKSLNEKYRMYRKNIEVIMGEDNSVFDDILKEKKERIFPLVESVMDHAKNEKLQIQLVDLTGSLIHMMMNRLFRSNNRQYELLLYHFITKYYRSAKVFPIREMKA